MTAPPSSISDLRALYKIIGDGISVIEDSYAKEGTPLPDLDDPSPSKTPQDPAFSESTNLVIAAAYQLIANVRTPAASILVAGAGVCRASLSSGIHR